MVHVAKWEPERRELSTGEGEQEEDAEGTRRVRGVIEERRGYLDFFVAMTLIMDLSGSEA